MFAYTPLHDVSGIKDAVVITRRYDGGTFPRVQAVASICNMCLSNVPLGPLQNVTSDLRDCRATDVKVVAIQ